MKGYISSYETLGGVDGPGIRFVVFFSGCNLRCKYCHNPETWEEKSGYEVKAKDFFEKIKRYKSYFGKSGGVTFSGGEPLLQSAFLKKLILMCREEGIHTAIDTSGSLDTKEAYEVSLLADLIILDIKMISNHLYQFYIGTSLDKVIKYLKFINENKKKIWIRNVIVPGVNDDEKSILKLKEILKNYKYVEKYEFLPFKNTCQVKYDNLSLPFFFKGKEHCPPEVVKKAYSIYNK